MQNLDFSFKEELNSLKEKNLYRSLKLPHSIDLSSNDYLGLSENLFLKEKFKEGVEIFGLGSTASRLIRGHRNIFSELEEKFSELVNSEDSLFLANGFVANLGLIDCISDKDTILISDKLNHASIHDGIRISNSNTKRYYNHNDLNQIEKILNQFSSQKKILITDSLFSMDGDFCKLEEILFLKEKYNFTLILDDAHSLGIFGENGNGFSSKYAEQIEFRTFTCGKSFGLEGALISCSKITKEYLINKLRTFIFSTAPIPAIAYTLFYVIDLIKEMNDERKQILENSNELIQFLSTNQFQTGNSVSHIIPVFLKNEKFAIESADFFAKNGFDIRAIRSPTVKEPRLRISMNSKLKKEDFEKLKLVFLELKKYLISEGYSFE